MKCKTPSSPKKKYDDDCEVLDKFREMAGELSKNYKNSSTLKEIEKFQNELSKKQKKKEKKMSLKNTTKFNKLLNDKNSMSDVKFFKEKLNLESQTKMIEEVEKLKKLISVEKPYRVTLLESKIPDKFKAVALKKINALRGMSQGAGEYYKMKTWIDGFMSIPFNIYQHLPVSINDPIEKCQDFMEDAKNTLDKSVYGMDDAKLQIMQLVGQWISNPSATGTAIAIKGPMGTGKTTLIKDGVSKILNREFAFIALGGATDSSFLEGHSYTYEGSLHGKIVDILIQCKTMNPVIYFDELDKISDTPKGEEIVGILTHLTDTSQNSAFHDKYFAEIDFDLSKCLFIFSYNDESKVNPILRDRMYRILTKGYKIDDKKIIASNYLIPNIETQVNFEKNQIIIPSETIEYIAENLTEKEEGVRNLKRCLEIIYTKINLFRFMKPESDLFGKDMSLNIEFPVTVDKELVDKLIKKENNSKSYLNMYL